jgi:hypothetical protein
MKKVFLTMLISVLGMGFVNAQIYVGGSLSLGASSTKPEVGEDRTNSSFTLAPEVGYRLSPDFEVGASLTIANSTTDDGTTEVKSNSWALSPYARYSFIEFGKFSIWGQAGLSLSGGEANAQKSTSFGLNIQPVLKYNLSDKFDLLTNLNFLNIGFSQTSIKDVSTTARFNFGVNSGNVANLGGITVGFLYKF